MDGRHEPAEGNEGESPGLAARLIMRYAEPTSGFSSISVLSPRPHVPLLTGDGFGRLAHPVLGLAPAIATARILKVELLGRGEVRARLV